MEMVRYFLIQISTMLYLLFRVGRSTPRYLQRLFLIITISLKIQWIFRQFERLMKF